MRKGIVLDKEAIQSGIQKMISMPDFVVPVEEDYSARGVIEKLWPGIVAMEKKRYPLTEIVKFIVESLGASVSESTVKLEIRRRKSLGLGKSGKRGLRSRTGEGGDGISSVPLKSRPKVGLDGSPSTGMKRGPKRPKSSISEQSVDLGEDRVQSGAEVVSEVASEVEAVGSAGVGTLEADILVPEHTQGDSLGDFKVKSSGVAGRDEGVSTRVDAARDGLSDGVRPLEVSQSGNSEGIVVIDPQGFLPESEVVQDVIPVASGELASGVKLKSEKESVEVVPAVAPRTKLRTDRVKAGHAFDETDL